MKCMGVLLLCVGIAGIIATVLLTEAVGWGGLVAGITALLTGTVFVAAEERSRVQETADGQNQT